MLLLLRNCCRLTLNLNSLISKNQKCRYKISILSLSRFSSHSKNVFMPPEEFLKAKEDLKNNGATMYLIVYFNVLCFINLFLKTANWQ